MFKSIPYLFSQYVWIMILAFFACIPFLLPHQNKGSIKSLENYNKFNQSQVPVVFTHISDVHIDHINSNPAYYFNKTIDLITNVIKPEFNVITGDLANNFPGSHIPIYGRQQPSDIKMYTAYSEPLKNAFPVFEVDGNHDVFGIYDYQTKHNQSDYYKSQNLSQYQLSVYSYLIHNRNYTFIGLNPFDFPSPHPPLLYNARPTKELLDQLEKTVQTVKEENQNDVEIVIFNHFPYFEWKFGPRSSTGKNFNQIIKESDISLFLDGHLHPNEPQFMRHDGFLEIVGCDLLEHQKFSVAVIDNGRFSYHTIDLKKDDEVLAFVTNPVPDELLSNHQIFNEKVTAVRVIVYSKEDDEPSLTATVSNGVLNDDQLLCSKTFLNESFRFWLCQTELKIENEGTYNLNINGTVERSFDFTISSDVKCFSEKVYEPSSSFVIQYQVQLALIWFFLFIILFPFIRAPENMKCKFDMWIHEQSYESMWLYSIFLGFLAVKSRIERLPKLIRYSLFIFCIWPLCLPTVFVTIDHKFGFVWTWGFVCKGQHFDIWGQMFSLMYLSVFLLPIVILFSALSLSLPLRWTLIPEVFLTLICLCFDVYILLRWCNESGGHLGASFSLFSITLVYFYTLMIVWRCYWKKGLKEISLIPSTALLDNESHDQ